MDEYVNQKTLAEMVGIAPSTLSAYRARGDSHVPEPDLQIGSLVFWHISTARKWVEERNGE